jgi:precorrin-2 dehydrogenase / sirohydrochlorin ferrochelatase
VRWPGSKPNPSSTSFDAQWEPSDLVGAFVCVATDPSPSVRADIHREARARGVLVNMVDDIPNCDFAVPAIVRRGDLLVTISTCGRSPALARRLREELGERFGPEWSAALDVLGEVRARTLSALPDIAERSRRWQEALDVEELLELVRDGRGGEARERLVRRLLSDPQDVRTAATR